MNSLTIYFGEKSIRLSGEKPGSGFKKQTIIKFRSRKQLKKAFQKFTDNEKIKDLIIYSKTFFLLMLK